MKKRRLIYRLSSLGDLAIAMAVLEFKYDGESSWVVSREFAPLLESRADVSRIISFDRRRESLLDWVKLNWALAREGYDEVFDLHRTTRTKLARLVFLVAGVVKTCGNSSSVTWTAVSKERWKRLGYCTLKRYWPRSLRPLGLRRQILRMFAPHQVRDPVDRNVRMARVYEASRRSKLGLAPSSAWRGKEWPAERFALLAQHLHRDFDLVLLGTAHDQNAIQVRDRLLAGAIPFEDALGRYRLGELLGFLATLDAVVSCDSGLAHLSELANVPVVAVYGPTRSDFGFGLKGLESASIDTSLWCSPCSKDGSLCFRLVGRYKCLSMISVEEVERAVRRTMGDASERKAGSGVLPP